MTNKTTGMMLHEFITTLNVGNPTKFENLEVFPLFSDRSRDNGYALLDEAITTDRFTVTEVSEGGHVPELAVTNLLDSDVLIVDGEELVGAKQNRIVNTTIIIGKMQKVVIPVSCVEQGRWHYRSRKFSSGSSNLYAALRSRKAKSVHSNLKRNAKFASNQSEIWNDISDKAARFSVSSETSAMDDIFQSNEGQMRRYEEGFTVVDGQIGFVAVIGGRIAGMDLFSSRAVLPKMYRKLLRGYILDAIDQKQELKRKPSHEPATSASHKGDSEESVAAFLKEITSARKDTYKSVGAGDELRFGNRQVNGFALVNNDDVVHLAAFAE